MKASATVLYWLLLSGSLLLWAQSNPGKPVAPTALEHDFFAVLRSGDALQFLSYIPEDGVNLGQEAQHKTRAEIEEQLKKRTGLFCQLFDSSCIESTVKLDASTTTCSYRELLTQSEKVRTASTETTRNGVRQAILVAEVHNRKCAGPGLIDFIFNYHESGWKLFSIP